MQKLRWLLWPFSVLYDAITRLRNVGFDRGWLPSVKFDIPVWTIGNLSTGGTGKTPMTEYLLRRFLSTRHMAVLSRGYGRKTKGFRWVTSDGKVTDFGDEPLQMKRKFPDLPLAVDAHRRAGINKIMTEVPEVDLIILDDAFQHRYVYPSKTVLLTAYGNLYADDCLLPAGNLRESSLGAKRADVVVVTKCPQKMSGQEKSLIEKKLNLTAGKNLFFSRLSYADTVIGDNNKIPLADFIKTPFTLVTGIANPAPLVTFMQEQGANFEHLKFDDHHFFTSKEIDQLNDKSLILTTEKDYIRLKGRVNIPLYYLEIEMIFLEKEDAFLSALG